MVLSARDRLPSTEYQPLEDKQPPVRYGERTGFQAVITSPWVMRWAAIPATYATYRAIRKNSTIALARELAVAPILASDWTIDAKKDVPQEWKDLIEDVFFPLRDEFLATALYYGDIDFGYQCWEKVIMPKDGYDKIVRLKQLYHDITEICIGHKGGFIGVRQLGTDLGLHNSVHVGFRVEGSLLYGIPLLENVRQIYNWWTDCNEGARRYDRKIAGCHIVVEYPPGSAFDRNGKEVENYILAQRVLDGLEAAGGVSVPRDMAPFMQQLNLDSPGWKIWILDAGGSQQVSFCQRLEYLDKQLCRGLHIPERAMLEGQHGTLAEAEAHGDVVFTIQDIKHRRVTAELNRQAVDQTLFMNFGKKAVGKVWLKPSPIADKKKAFFAQLYTSLLGSPAGLHEIQSLDLASMRTQLGLPTVPNDVDRVPPGEQPTLQPVPGLSADGERSCSVVWVCDLQPLGFYPFQQLPRRHRISVNTHQLLEPRLVVVEGREPLAELRRPRADAVVIAGGVRRQEAGQDRRPADGQRPAGPPDVQEVQRRQRRRGPPLPHALRPNLSDREPLLDRLPGPLLEHYSRRAVKSGKWEGFTMSAPRDPRDRLPPYLRRYCPSQQQCRLWSAECRSVLYGWLTRFGKACARSWSVFDSTARLFLFCGVGLALFAVLLPSVTLWGLAIAGLLAFGWRTRRWRELDRRGRSFVVFGNLASVGALTLAMGGLSSKPGDETRNLSTSSAASDKETLYNSSPQSTAETPAKPQPPPKLPKGPPPNKNSQAAKKMPASAVTIADKPPQFPGPRPTVKHDAEMDEARLKAHQFAMDYFATKVPAWFAFNPGWGGSPASDTIVVRDGNRFRVRGWISAHAESGKPHEPTRIDYVCEMVLDRDLKVWHKINVEEVR